MFAPAVSVFLLSVALAWAVFFQAGIHARDWSVSLLLIGGVSIFYAAAAPGARRAGPLPKSLCWATCLLTGYLALELLPFPLPLLHLLSPARAELSRAVALVSPGIRYAPLSVNAPAAVLASFTLLACIATFLLVRELSSYFRSDPWFLAIPLVVIAAAEAALGLFQVFARWPAGQATGTYTNYDHFAALLETVLPLASLYGFSILRRGGATSSTGRTLAACSLWFVAALLLVSIVYSFSRMAFLVTACVLFGIALLSIGPHLPNGARRWSLGSVGVLVLVLLFFLPPDQLLARFAALSSTEKLSGNERVLIWKESLRVISEFPIFGCGLGGFEAAFLKYQASVAAYRVEFAHNDYLQYLAELGLLGFSLLAAAVGALLAQIVRPFRQAAEEDRRLLALACAAAFAAVLLHSFVEFNMYIPANAMTLAWIGGLGSANARD